MNMNLRLSLFALSLGFIAVVWPWNQSSAAVKTSVTSGNWSSSTCWSPSGAPTNTDSVVIQSGHTISVDGNRTIGLVTIQPGGILTWPTNNPKTLTINGDIAVNGTLNMIGDLTLAASKNVTVGSSGSVVWDPKSNTLAGSTFFTNGIESYQASSTLQIKKWYDYNVPLGSVVSSHFGNLKLNSISGNTIFEWNQNNWFETRRVLGTLTIETAWITLDKSGSMTTTPFQAIVLSSINSSLYGHVGTHPGTATITASSITNNGGEFAALVDGNGNMNVQVSGNITNTGFFNVIYNTGVANVGNGNANLTVGGSFSQTAGDTRFIYNVSTTQCGLFQATVNDLSISGGFFTGQTGVNANTTSNCTLQVVNHFTASFTANSNIFRGLSLTSIGNSINNYGFVMLVGGNLVLGGSPNAEFTGSAGKGNEIISIGGNMNVSGATNCFNYPLTTASHALTMTVDGSMSQSGGTLYFSREAGNANVTVSSSLSISGGSMNLKGSTGSTVMTVSGSGTLSGGTLTVHNNTTTTTSDISKLNILGTFLQSGGTLQFDNNTSNSNADQEVYLKGSSVNFSGSGVITRASAGTGTSFGRMYFSSNGNQTYTRTNGHSITQVKQSVLSNCTLYVAQGPVQVASHPVAATDFFSIRSGSRVEMNDQCFLSNNLYPNCGIQVDSAGTLSLTHTNGMYNGTANATIASTGNMDFTLDSRSVVEYKASSNQIVTGINNGLAPHQQHRYGILKINLQGPSTSYAYPTSSHVEIRSQLQLENGEFNLNGYPITINNGNPDGIIRNSGYVKSETNLPDNGSKIIWNNIQSGVHIFPFGTSSGYFPVEFKPLNDLGTSVGISTRSTLATSNEPLPVLVPLDGDLSSPPIQANTTHGLNEAIDRWWDFDMSPTMSADITLRYNGTENTLPAPANTGALGIASWNTTAWNLPSGTGIGTTSGIGVTSGYGLTGLNHVLITSQTIVLPVELLEFSVKKSGPDQVSITWSTASEKNNDYFTVERSHDGVNFQPLIEVPGSGNSNQQRYYSAIDNDPFPGLSYYRLSQTDYDGSSSHSEIRFIQFQSSAASQPVSVDKIGPNPFENNVDLVVTLKNPGAIELTVHDMTGKIVWNQKESGYAGSNSIHLENIGFLSRGTYFLEIESNHEIISQKIIRK